MQVKNFENVLSANKNREIGLYLNNNQFVDGILLDVKKDHIVLEVNRNIVYFAIHQIQALSKNAKDYSIAIETSPHLDRNDLTDVLIALRYHWVTVNDFGNHVLNGVLNSIFEDHIILINNKELLFIPKSYITNISSNISKNDLIFLNKKEQINIQKLYKTSISKGLMEVEKSYPISPQETVIPEIDILMNDELEVPTDIEKLEKNITVSNQEKAISNAGILVNVELEVPTFSEELENNDATSMLEKQLDNVMEIECVNLAPDGLVEIDLKQVETQNFEENDEVNTVELKHKETHISNSLIDDEALSYSISRSKQKSVPLTAWSAMNSDQSTIAIPKNMKSKSEVPVENPITVKQNLDLNNSKSDVNHAIEERKSEVEFEALDEKPKPAEKKKPSKTVNAISPKEINKNLENQYYALMNYATKQITNSIKNEQEGGKSFFHPSYNNEFYKLDENRASFKNFGTSETNTYSPKEEKDALEKQYISLMRHATKMYRTLREYSSNN